MFEVGEKVLVKDLSGILPNGNKNIHINKFMIANSGKVMTIAKADKKIKYHGVNLYKLVENEESPSGIYNYCEHYLEKLNFKNIFNKVGK